MLVGHRANRSDLRLQETQVGRGPMCYRTSSRRSVRCPLPAAQHSHSRLASMLGDAPIRIGSESDSDSLPLIDFHGGCCSRVLASGMRAAQENGRGRAGLRGTNGDPPFCTTTCAISVHPCPLFPDLPSPRAQTKLAPAVVQNASTEQRQRACVRHAATTTRLRRWTRNRLRRRGCEPAGPQLDYSEACRSRTSCRVQHTHPLGSRRPIHRCRRGGEPSRSPVGIRIAALQSRLGACCARPRASAFAKHRS